MLAVVKSCEQFHTYEINGHEATYLGAGDLHDRSYDGRERSVSLAHEDSVNDGQCCHEIFIYLTDKFKDAVESSLRSV